MLVDQTTEWGALAEHQRVVAGTTLRELFAADPTRGPAMTVTAGDLSLDYSKNRLTAETVDLLVRVAERAGLTRYMEGLLLTRNRYLKQVAEMGVDPAHLPPSSS